MNKIALLPVAALIFTLTGCTSDYTVNTKSGDSFISHGKPELDKESGMTSYTDLNGDYHLMNTNDIAGMTKI
ncbi:lipoprotein [Enterobacterales bacterium]|nr:lipoprotein [Enterobacterales bacterium]